MTRPVRWVATLVMLTAVSTSVGGAEPSTPRENFAGIPAQTLDSIRDVAAGPAAIRGRVVHEEESANVGGIPVVLYAQSPDGAPGLRAERSLDLPVSDAISDTSGVAVSEVRIEVEQNCESLAVRESHRLDNPGARTIFVPESERNDREPILRVTLPDGAFELQAGLGDDLEQNGNALSFWGPLRPGQRKLEFSYAITERGPAFEMRHSFPSGARRLVLVDHPGGPTLTRSGPDDAELRPGDSIALRVELPATADSVEGISALEARIWLELDGAALTVEQQYTLAVEGDMPLLAAPGAPLLCVALPDGADDLRFSANTLAMGLSRDPSGALALRGPLPAGETEIALRFLLPIERSDPLFSQVMPLDMPLLSVLIADTGLVIETSRLHRKRPMRTPDRNYLHLEAFEIPAGEPVELQLRPLDARKSLPKSAAMGVALATAAIAVGFLIAPLRQAGAEPDMPPSAANRAAEQRESLLTAIRSLDEDFEVGKLSETDYREMRLALRAEAVNLLRVERATLAEAAEADSTPRSCLRCEAEVGADARFCSQCGTPLDEPGSADEVPPV
jgi:ribosomal protein L40E